MLPIYNKKRGHIIIDKLLMGDFFDISDVGEKHFSL